MSITHNTKLLAGSIAIGVIAILLIISLATGTISGSTSVQQDQVIATVNGEEITRGELEQLKTQVSQVRGSEVGSDQEEQLLDQLIDQTLIEQAAADDGITVSDEAVSTEFSAIASQVGGSQALNQRLSDTGTNAKEMRGLIREQLLFEQYVDQFRGDIDVTDEEVRTFYEQASAVSPESIPPFAEVEEQLRGQVEQQKINELLQERAQELRGEATIETQL